MQLECEEESGKVDEGMRLGKVVGMKRGAGVSGRLREVQLDSALYPSTFIFCLEAYKKNLGI